MTGTDLEGQIAAAEAYEDLFVPSLFGQWAGPVCDAAGLRSGDDVLDVGCGTGVLAREAAARVGPEGSVAGVDVDPGMLEVAARRAPDIEWRRGVASSLPYPDASFDAVVSQFSLMFFPDRAGAIREMLRVLRPGGRVAVAVWDRIENAPGYAAEVALLERAAGTEAADAVRAPFVLGDPDMLQRLFRDAGAASIELRTEERMARFPSVRTMVEADLRGWLPVMGVTLDEDRIQRILDEAEDALGDYRQEDGRAVFAVRAHIVRAIEREP